MIRSVLLSIWDHMLHARSRFALLSLPFVPSLFVIWPENHFSSSTPALQQHEVASTRSKSSGITDVSQLCLSLRRTAR
jgi:hypothetical protein